jgi:flagellar hook-associated protein 3 FlgL
MRVSDTQQFDMARYQLQSSSQRLYELRQEAASGKKNLQASEDPGAYTRALFLQGEKTAAGLFDAASQRARQRLDTYDQSLGSLSDLVGQARTLALQGASDSTDASVRPSLASTVDDLLHRALTLANDQQDGRYVYGGTRSGAPPFETVESNGQVTAVQYVGSERVGSVGLESGDTVRVAISASQVFGSPPDGDASLMGSLIRLRDALASGDTAASGEVATALEDAGSRLASARGEVGTRQQHLDSLARFRQATGEQLDLQLSSVQDADLPATITSLTQQQLSFQAALQVAAQLGKNTLFDYLR